MFDFVEELANYIEGKLCQLNSVRGIITVKAASPHVSFRASKHLKLPLSSFLQLKERLNMDYVIRWCGSPKNCFEFLAFFMYIVIGRPSFVIWFLSSFSVKQGTYFVACLGLRVTLARQWIGKCFHSLLRRKRKKLFNCICYKENLC